MQGTDYETSSSKSITIENKCNVEIQVVAMGGGFVSRYCYASVRRASYSHGHHTRVLINTVINWVKTNNAYLSQMFCDRLRIGGNIATAAHDCTLAGVTCYTDAARCLNGPLYVESGTQPLLYLANCSTTS